MSVTLDRALSIQGWMSDLELHFLAETAQKSKDILEIGSYKGRSTRALADNTDGIIHCIDPWDGKYQVYGSKTYPDLAFQSFIHQNGDDTIFGLFECNLADHLKSGKVVVHRCNFDQFQIKKKFDFIFIDAIHEYQAVKNDIQHALTMMKSGILAGHDYCNSWPGVVKAIDEIFPNKKLEGSIWTIQI